MARRSLIQLSEYATQAKGIAATVTSINENPYESPLTELSRAEPSRKPWHYWPDMIIRGLLWVLAPALGLVAAGSAINDFTGKPVIPSVPFAMAGLLSAMTGALLWILLRPR